MTICVLGRQPELGTAELEALYGSTNVQPLGDHCALVDKEVDFERLGGSVKSAQLLDILQTDNIKVVFKRLAQLMPNILRTTPAGGKIKFGISSFGFDISPYKQNGEALRLKKVIQATGRSVRVVPGESAALSSAQTYHNHLTDGLGLEIIIVKDGTRTIIGRVNAVQNIDAYRIRDRERPKRDPFVGMLPPKLAQIIVNLAIGKSEIERSKDRKIESELPKVNSKIYVLDPFCGTGVILQEALLMGYDVIGTDLSPKMVDYSKANIDWLVKDLRSKTLDLRKSQENKLENTLEIADATTYNWPLLRSQISDLRSSVAIATETYLGQPLGGQNPSQEKLAEIIHDTNEIIRGFLQNISKQLPSGARLCVAVPAWFTEGLSSRLPLVADIESLGYEPVHFSHAATPLIYHREGQVTGRELLVLIKK